MCLFVILIIDFMSMFGRFLDIWLYCTGDDFLHTFFNGLVSEFFAMDFFSEKGLIFLKLFIGKFYASYLVLLALLLLLSQNFELLFSISLNF